MRISDWSSDVCSADLFPYSSPLAMIAYAAREPEIWPHVVALFWQALWVAITVSVAAGWFKRGVLKSGPSRRRSARMRRRPVERQSGAVGKRGVVPVYLGGVRSS